ncbi:MAG: hypothetical protein HYW48_05595 [Deltaproteobacteria bacterium]|nr:hypothetical protein [Deltaproteobacteria bacterium]
MAPLHLATPSEFFREQVVSALSEHNLSVSQHVEYYIVNLLCGFINPEKLTGDEQLNILDTPLALLLKRAIEAPVEERVKILKILGDFSLYISGFFQDYFNRKTYNVDYFITIGTNAYSHVSVITRTRFRDYDFASLYGDLATYFPNIVEVVSHISDKLETPKHQNILSMYERWVSSKSERLFNKLKEHGIIPIENNPKTKQ